MTEPKWHLTPFAIIIEIRQNLSKLSKPHWLHRLHESSRPSSSLKMNGVIFTIHINSHSNTYKNMQFTIFAKSKEIIFDNRGYTLLRVRCTPIYYQCVSVFLYASRKTSSETEMYT